MLMIKNEKLLNVYAFCMLCALVIIIIGKGLAPISRHTISIDDELNQQLEKDDQFSADNDTNSSNNGDNNVLMQETVDAAIGLFNAIIMHHPLLNYLCVL